MEKYDITASDRNLMEISLKCLNDNFDDGIYNHTVGCASLCKNGNVYKGVNYDEIHGSCAEYMIEFIISDICKLHKFTDSNVKILDWQTDFELINQFYKEGFAIYDLLKDDPDEFESLGTVAYIKDNKIISLADIMKIHENELQIGAVATIPIERNKGYCKAVVSVAAEKILSLGYIAKLTTKNNNIAMQKVAKAIGMLPYKD